MSSLLIASIAIISMFGLIALQVPLAAAMGLAGFVAFGLLSGFGPALSLFGSETASVLSYTDLAVIPLFLLMGGFASASGLTKDVYRVAEAFLGHYRGGLAMATIGGCAGFGAVCGSSIATAATMTKVALPEMTRRGYKPGLATGSIAAGGTLGILIPPSTMMVLYAFLTEQPVLPLFVAAVIPGILAALLHFVAIAIYVRFDPAAGPSGPRMNWRERLHVLKQAWGVLALIVVVSGGIYGGIFTVTEAAAVGATVAFGFAIFRKSLTWSLLFEIFKDAASATTMIYLLVIGASILTYFLTLSRMPEAVIGAIQGMNASPILIIGMLMIVYIILGSIFDTVAAMVITMPFVFPLVMDMGYSPVWWGVINVMVIEIGMITPPIGINVFVLNSMAPHIPLKTIFRGVLPFFGADLVRLALVIIFPALALWLPGL